MLFTGYFLDKMKKKVWKKILKILENILFLALILSFFNLLKFLLVSGIISLIHAGVYIQEETGKNLFPLIGRLIQFESINLIIFVISLIGFLWFNRWGKRIKEKKEK